MFLVDGSVAVCVGERESDVADERGGLCVWRWGPCTYLRLSSG